LHERFVFGYDVAVRPVGMQVKDVFEVKPDERIFTFDEDVVGTGVDGARTPAIDEIAEGYINCPNKVSLIEGFSEVVCRARLLGAVDGFSVGQITEVDDGKPVAIVNHVPGRDSIEG